MCLKNAKNGIWYGSNEMEFLLGFPKNRTRRISKTERYRSLDNSFQVDCCVPPISTQGHVSTRLLRTTYQYSGIGGAEAALHMLGIRMNYG